MINNYDGDKQRLGGAEKFFYHLSKLNGYRMRVDGMVLKDEFRSTMDVLKPDVETVIKACEQLMESASLKEFLRFVLHTGNFLNAVSNFHKSSATFDIFRSNFTRRTE